MTTPKRPIEAVDTPRDLSKRVYADARADVTLDVIDADAEVLFNQYQLSHRRVERWLREKYDAPRPAEREEILQHVDDGDRIGCHVLSRKDIRVFHRLVVGEIEFQSGDGIADALIREPTIYSWPRGDASELEVLTETAYRLSGPPLPRVELAVVDTLELFVAPQVRSGTAVHHDPLDGWGPVVDAVADPDIADLEALVDDDVSLGGDP